MHYQGIGRALTKKSSRLGYSFHKPARLAQRGICQPAGHRHDGKTKAESSASLRPLSYRGCSLFRVGSAHCACRLLQSVDPALQTLTHRTISHSLVPLNAITQLLDDYCILFHLCSSLCSARCRTVSLFLFLLHKFTHSRANTSHTQNVERRDFTLFSHSDGRFAKPC